MNPASVGPVIKFEIKTTVAVLGEWADGVVIKHVDMEEF